MSDGLSVIRRAVGVPAPSGLTPEQASGAEAVEAAVLAQSLQALDALPREQPDAAVLARIADAAAAASELDALAAVRGACGLGPVQHTAEGALLAQSVAALDALPAAAPSPEAERAVEAHAHEATFAPLHAASGGAEALDGPEASAGPEAAVLAQSLRALEALPSYAPSPEALAAVLARAAAPEASGVATTSVEDAIAEQSEAALATLPVYAPSAEAMDAVLVAAQEATFAPLLAASGGGEVAGVEAELLRQSLRALDALPHYAPDAEALAAVEGAALNATFAPLHAAYGDGTSDTPEAGLLAQSKQALGALPTYSPSAAALEAVMISAAAASSVTTIAAAQPASPAVRQRRASDRGAVQAARPRKMRGIVAGVATLAVALIAAVTLLDPGLGVVSPETEMVASADIVETTPAPAPMQTFAEPIAPQPDPEPLATVQAPRPVVQRVAPSGPSADGFDVAARQQVAASAPALRSRAPRSRAPEAAALVAEADAAPEATTDWEAGEDVRLLSLRLQQLREQNSGLEWDEPAVAFDGASGGSQGTTRGIQAVRESAPLGRALARTRTPSTDRR